MVPASTSRCPLRVHVKRIERLARCHEQPVVLGSAETEVGAALRWVDAADQLAFRRIDENAIQFGSSHSPAAP
jgi:hypothetical protein